MGRAQVRRLRAVRTALLAAVVTTTSLFGIGAAYADEISVPPVTIPPTDTDFSQIVAVEQFDPALGTLTAVRVELTGEVTGTMGIENTSTSSASTGSITLSANVSVSLTSDPSVSASPTSPSVTEPFSLPTFDGVIDFGGTSGVFFDAINGSETITTTLTDAALLAAATGTGTVDLTVDAMATSDANGTGGNLVTQFLTQAGATIAVTYVFDAFQPAIDIEKATNGEDADEPTGPDIEIGDPVEWTYVVTNTGSVDLTSVVVVDDQGVAVSCPQDTLAVEESMTCTASGTAVLGQYANIGTVTALGEETEVTDSDPSHYRGIDTIREAVPMIEIVKDPATQTLLSGETATFTITVTNPVAGVDLVNVTVTDPLAPDCDNVIGDLAGGESVTYTCTVEGVTADFTNVATVTGEDSTGTSVSDNDDAEVIVIGPEIDIVKDPDLQIVTIGTSDDTVEWDITVTNTGTVDLVNVVVTDPQAPNCDRTIGDLAAGESFTYECSRSGVTASFTNVATVTGEDNAGNPVSDFDDARVEVELVASGSESERMVAFGIVILGLGAALLSMGRRRWIA